MRLYWLTLIQDKMSKRRFICDFHASEKRSSSMLEGSSRSQEEKKYFASKFLNELPSDSEIGSCEGEFIVDGKGWAIKLKPSPSCQTQLSNLSELPSYVQKYVTKHMETNEK